MDFVIANALDTMGRGQVPAWNIEMRQRMIDAKLIVIRRNAHSGLHHYIVTEAGWQALSVYRKQIAQDQERT